MMTNYERIKSMNVDEVAEFLSSITEYCCNEDCDTCPLRNNICDRKGAKNWLNSEVEI